MEVFALVLIGTAVAKKYLEYQLDDTTRQPLGENGIQEHFQDIGGLEEMVVHPDSENTELGRIALKLAGDYEYIMGPDIEKQHAEFEPLNEYNTWRHPIQSHPSYFYLY